MSDYETSTQIKKYLRRYSAGKPFTTSSLLGFGSRAAVDKFLSREVQSGSLMRVARGIYAKPQKNAYVGIVPPSQEAVANAVAKTENATIQAHGAEALRRFGLSTQESMSPVYLTTGATRNINMGRLQIKLKHVNARNFAGLNGRAAEALTALRYLGREKATEDILLKIKNQLTREEYTALYAARAKMPGWLADLLRKVGR